MRDAYSQAHRGSAIWVSSCRTAFRRHASAPKASKAKSKIVEADPGESPWPATDIRSGCRLAISPLLAGSSPANKRSRVDFPAPLGPTIAIRSPGLTEKDTSSKSGQPQVYANETPEKASKDITPHATEFLGKNSRAPLAEVFPKRDEGLRCRTGRLAAHAPQELDFYDGPEVGL